MTSQLYLMVDRYVPHARMLSSSPFMAISTSSLLSVHSSLIRPLSSSIFTQLVGQLIKEGKKDKALAALDYAEKMIPAINVPYDWANGAFQMAESYYQLGQNEKANKIIDELANKSLEYMIWYLSLNDNQLAIASENFVYNASLLDAEVRLMEKYKSEELAKHYSTQLDQLYNEYVTRMKGK